MDLSADEIVDLGLATQFSASEPKLTTCCGSPAFHVSMTLEHSEFVQHERN